MQQPGRQVPGGERRHLGPHPGRGGPLHGPNHAGVHAHVQGAQGKERGAGRAHGGRLPSTWSACARTCTFDEKFTGADAATNDKLDAERGCLEADYSEAIAKRDKTINSHFVHFSDICENLDLKTTEEMKSLEIKFSDKCAALVRWTRTWTT